MSSSSDSDSDDDGIDELREPKTWDDVADLINDDEKDDMAELYFTGRSAVESTSATSPSFDESGKFKDPLGILRLAPKGAKKLPDVDEEGFDPVKLLAALHSQTRYDELVGGARRLARKLSSQEEDIKQLVRDNFDRFVSCKDVIDNLYSLILENEISVKGTGTVKLEHTYADIVARAKGVYSPLLMRQDETDKIRQALSILSRFSFLFGLPSKIAANIKSGDYEKAVQHYKKATALAEDSKVGLFKKVMGEVETIITEFRASLYTSLADPNASFEAQVKIIRLLVDLGRKSSGGKDQEDPGWYYLQNTASRLITLLNDSKSVRVMCTIVTRQVPNLWKMGGHYLGGKFDANSKERALAQAHPEAKKSINRVPDKDVPKAVPVRIYYVDETFASLRIDATKTCADIIDQCMRRLPLEETELYTEDNFAVYTWIEKRKKEGTHIKVTELAPDEKLYKIHKKWGDNKSGNTHKFLFKRKDLKFPRVVDSRDKVTFKKLEDVVDKVEKEGPEKRAGGKVRTEAEFYSLVASVLQVFSTKVEDMLFADAVEDPDYMSDPELPPESTGNDQEWAFGKMREDVACVVSAQAAFLRAGVKDKPLAAISNLSLSISRSYVLRVCSQWAAEVSLLYLSFHKEYQKDGADAPSSLFSVTYLPNQFTATTRFYVSQLRGVGICGRNHPLLPQILSAFAEVIKCFGDCLHHIAFTSVTSSHMNIRQENSGFGFVSQFSTHETQRIGSTTNKLERMPSSGAGGGVGAGDGGAGDEISLSRDGWMIAGRAHVEYTRNNVIPTLWKLFVEEFKLGTADQKSDEEIMSSVEVLQLLGGMFLERYIHSKTLAINTIVVKGLQLSGVDWGLTVVPKSVSEYVMTMLLHFVYVHSEVVSVSGNNIPNITSKVIAPLIANALLAINRSVMQMEGFSVWGLWQIRLDLEFFESILAKYNTRDTDAISRNIRDLLDRIEDDVPHREDYDERGVKADMNIIVDETVKKSSILFSCLLEKT